WNTRYQNVNPNSEGSLCGKYHFSAKAHRKRLSNGPKIANAISASTNARNNMCVHRGSARSVIPAQPLPLHAADKMQRPLPPPAATAGTTHWLPHSQHG